MICLFNVERCQCRSRACKDYHIWPVAAVQGVKFTKEQAEAVAKLLTEMEKEQNDV